jgi:hypothetical protein
MYVEKKVIYLIIFVKVLNLRIDVLFYIIVILLKVLSLLLIF